MAMLIAREEQHAVPPVDVLQHPAPPHANTNVRVNKRTILMLFDDEENNNDDFVRQRRNNNIIAGEGLLNNSKH